MATGLSASMKAELQGLARVVPVFEVTLGGTTYRFAQESVASTSSGMYKRCVAKGGWGQLMRISGGKDMSLKSSEASVVVRDLDRVIGKALGGPVAGEVLGSVAKIYLRSAHVDSGDHYELLSGVISNYPLIDDLTYRFIIRPENEQVLRNENSIPTILKADFPNAPVASFGQAMQVVYGRHRTGGVPGATGMVPTVCVHSASDWFLVSTGRVKDVNKVYRNGSDATVDFDLEYRSANGKHFSIVRDTAGTSVDTDDITVDLDGVEPVGDGTGNYIANPATQLEHFLTNFVFGDWPAEWSPAQFPRNWLSAALYPINETHFDETKVFLSERNLEGSKVITTNDKPLDLINAFCKDYQVSPLWSWDWKIGVRPIPISNTTIYLDAAHVRQEHALSRLTMKPLINDMINKITVNYLFNEATSEYTKQRHVVDPARTPTLGATQGLEWDRSHI